jgi:hypothetical protein
LNWLRDNGFIIRYTAGGCRFIEIANFAKHQNPHKNEPESEIPAPTLRKSHSRSAKSASEKIGSSTEKLGSDPDELGTTRADSLLLIPDSPSLIPDSGLLKEEEAHSPPPPSRVVPPPEADKPVPTPAPALGLPPFSSERFAATWAKWVDTRKAMKKPLRNSMIEMQWKQLAEIGEANAITCVEKSIANGWQGLFPEKFQGPTHNGRAGSHPRPDLRQQILENGFEFINQGGSANDSP